MQNILKKNLFNQRGVTLIELIAVILILGIIAAVGIPVVFNQVEKANISADETKVGIINDAIERYALLNGNVYPALGTTGTGDIDKLISTLSAVESGDAHIGGPYLKADFDTSLKQAGKTWVITKDDDDFVTSVNFSL